MRLSGRSLRERNLTVIGIVGTLALIGVIALVLFVPKIPALSGTKSYAADFAQAAGLHTGDDVRVAGLPIGTVTGIHLDRNVIRVDFTVPNNIRLGDRTTAAIQIATLLGTQYVQLNPAGSGSSPGEVIPVSRTSVPFDLTSVTNGVTNTVNGLDLARMQRALNAVSGTLAHAPSAARQALDGLSGISKVITARQLQLQELLSHAKTITATLDAQRGSLDQLFSDADQVLRTVQARRAVIHALLRDSARLGHQLSHLIRSDGATLGPLLNRLRVVASVLRKDDGALATAVQRLAPATRYLANATGNGKYLDINLPYSVFPDNLLCRFSIVVGCS